MSDRKIISINPELFNLNNTRKKRGESKNKIKIRENKLNNKSTKGKLLRYIREQQEKNYKQLFDEKIKNSEKLTEPIKISLDETSNKDFEDSLDYLNSKLKNIEEQKNHNQTIKQHIKSDSEFFKPFLDNKPPFSSVTNNVSNSILPNSNIILKPFVNGQKPLFGCLKNGNLPTYRNYMNQTRKNNYFQQNSTPMNMIQPYNHNIINQIENNISKNTTISNNTKLHNHITHNGGNIQSQNSGGINQSQNLGGSFENSERLKNISELKQLDQLMNKNKSVVPKNLKYLKQKKTVKRTHYIGKSKKFPKIGVLVSNKTIRKDITTKTHLLKQETIQNIKRFLIKKGFIKVGSTAPNDVLRKMYESIILVGGEINNHNPENMMYNYLHDS